MSAYKPSALLIDLDDTLYDEKGFVLSGYRTVTAHIAKASAHSQESLFSYLHYVFLKFGRSGAFDRLTTKFQLDPSAVPELVRIYREHTPQISFYPGAKEALVKLRQSVPLAIVTDGASQVQRRKVSALGLSDLVDAVILCDEVGAAKPDVKGFVHAAQALGAPIEECIIVGDDPMHDLAAAKTLGIQAIRVKTGRFVDLQTPVCSPLTEEISNFSRLPETLATPYCK